MSDAKLNNVLELVIIACFAADLCLTYKMVYGVFPWESKAAS